ncbi:MAG: hypothetical protein M1826_002645 [Phylliscum demangeonii]|nr:MAG: hypothetical protein M1826_002645 [Phylliscum demangeonii]
MRLSGLAVVLAALFSLSGTARPVDLTSELHAQIRALADAQRRAEAADLPQLALALAHAPAYYGNRLADSITAPRPLHRLASGLSTGATTRSVANGAQALQHHLDRFGRWITSPAAIAHTSQVLRQKAHHPPSPELLQQELAAARAQAMQEYERERAWRAPDTTKENYEHPELDHLGRLVGLLIRIERLDVQIHSTPLPTLSMWERMTIEQSPEAKAAYHGSLVE